MNSAGWTWATLKNQPPRSIRWSPQARLSLLAINGSVFPAAYDKEWTRHMDDLEEQSR